MFTLGDLFSVLEPGTMVTAQDAKGYQILNEPFDGINPDLFEKLLTRTIKLIKAGYHSFRITLWDEESSDGD